LVITSRTSVDFTTAINPVYKLAVPPLSQQDGIELLRYYLFRLGLDSYPDEILAQAHERVDGHPYFLSRLAVLSETFPLPDILKSLPQLQSQIQDYVQEQVFSQLDERARRLIQNLSVLRQPFTLTAICNFDAALDATTSFEILLKKFLVTRTARNSPYYEIHDLVREYGLSQLTVEQKKVAHSQATNYYEALDPKTYTDGIETVNHALEADLQDRAHNASYFLVSLALHDGLFDLVIDFTSQLFEDERAKIWSKVHFARGRALRLKRKFSDALKSYENALRYARDEHAIEIAKLEIASILALQGNQQKSRSDLSKAKKLLGELAQSKNIETQVAALTSLGYLSINSEQPNKGIAQLNQALRLAEKAQLKRDIRQICQGLGEAHIYKDAGKATQYLDRANALRQETSSQYGGQDIDADYHLFEALAIVYNAQKRFDDAIKASEECVSIDRRLNLEERLANSLYQLGKDNCRLKRFEGARDLLQEGLSLIRKLNLHGEPETSTLVWLATALWNSQQYEPAIETILEYNFLNRHTEGFSSRHLVIQEADLVNGSKVDYNEKSLHVLVLPRMYDFRNLQQWNLEIVRRRPELALVHPLLLHKG
jgi:tetratricopeptide (TPR) repeat protein